MKGLLLPEEGRGGTEIRWAGVLPSFFDTLNRILKQHEMQPDKLFTDYFLFQCVSIRVGESKHFPSLVTVLSSGKIIWQQASQSPGERCAYDSVL